MASTRRSSKELSPRAVRADLVAQLRARVPEIERAILARIRALGPVGDEDQAYVAGLEAAVVAAVSFGLDSIEKGGEWDAPIPRETAEQARRSAQRRVRLDTVLRSYAAGNKTLEEFILSETDGIPSQVLCQVLSDQGFQVDRFMKAVSKEYANELEHATRSFEQKRARRVRHLLESSSLVSPADLDYDFDAWHLGMIVWGLDAEKSAQILAAHCDCQTLHMPHDRETAWMWLGSSRQARLIDIERILIEHTPVEASLAIGEPRSSLEGWRLTHREAQMALQVTLQKPKRLTRSRDVILLAGAMRDETLISSLLDTYLKPLEECGNASQALFASLRAYLSSGGNAVAAASTLGVTRQTVQRHITTVEQAIGRPLQTCHAELDVALQVDELNRLQGRRKRTHSAQQALTAP